MPKTRRRSSPSRPKRPATRKPTKKIVRKAVPKKAAKARRRKTTPQRSGKAARRPASKAKAGRTRKPPASQPAKTHPFARRTPVTPRPAGEGGEGEAWPMPPMAARPLRIVLFGASGNIGSRILHEALARGHRVTAAMRDPSKIGMQHPDLRAVRADATDPVSVAAVARGHDVVASAVSPAGVQPQMLAQAARSLMQGCRDAGVARLAVVGGAGSLEVAPGVKLLDTPEFPADWRPVGLAHWDALREFRVKGAGLDWTFVSPSARIAPGARTGKFRLGTDQLLVDPRGNSRISMEDYAVAFVDELEHGQNKGRRMTVGY